MNFFFKMLIEQILSYKLCYVYNDSHIDVCFKLEKGEMKYEIEH